MISHTTGSNEELDFTGVENRAVATREQEEEKLGLGLRH